MDTKRLFIVILFLSAFVCNAQIPEAFTYQAVVRNANNELVRNSPVKVQISIGYYFPIGLPPIWTFNSIYTETHQVTTNDNGLFSIAVGNGSVVSGRFDTIPWDQNAFSIKTEIDPANGNNYTISSISKILSVPYALHSKKAQNGIIAYGLIDSDGQILAGSGNYTVSKETMGSGIYYITWNSSSDVDNDKLIISITPYNTTNPVEVVPFTCHYTKLSDKKIMVMCFKKELPVNTRFSFTVVNPY